MNVYTKFNGNWCKSCWSAWVPSKVEDQWFHIYWATPAWWKIHLRYTIKKKKKTVTQAFTNHISSHLWRRKFQHSQNPLLNMTDLKRRARWILLKANPVRSEWRMWSKRKKHKRSMELTLTLSPFVRMSQSVCWNLVRSIWWPPPNNAWGEQVRIKQSTF